MLSISLFITPPPFYLDFVNKCDHEKDNVIGKKKLNKINYLKKKQQQKITRQMTTQQTNILEGESWSTWCFSPILTVDMLNHKN